MLKTHSGKRVAFDPLLGIFSATSTLVFTFDNFHVVLLLDAYKEYQEWVTGVAEVVICVIYVLVKLYELPELPSPVLALKSSIKFPICPGNMRIYRDTAVIVTLSYVLLLDINLSYLRLFIFPVIAIGFICMLCLEHWSLGENGELADSSNGHNTTIDGSEKALKTMAAVPFGMLLLIAQLNDDLADRFAISQFLLFLSTTLGALTYMMMRLPAGISTGVAPASELLHKAFFLLLLVTVHTVAAEVLGEDVVLFCMPELLPVLLWFSLHLDRDSSIIGVKKMKRPHRYVLLIPSAVVAALLSYLAIFMDKSDLSMCTTILVSCGVSGLLAHYDVFMLRQWPGQKTAGGNVDVAADITLQATSLLSRKKGGKDKGAAASLEVTVPSKEAGSCEDGVQLLKFWADALLIAAAALLVLRYVVATRLGLQEPLLETLCQNFRRLC